MAEPQVLRQHILSERARNERIARMGTGEGLRGGWGGSPYTQRAVWDMGDGIDFKNLSLTPHSDIGGKYNRYRVTADGNEYELQLLQPINRTNKRYDVTLMGGENVEYLDTIDLDRMSVQQARDYLRRKMIDYIERSR